MFEKKADILAWIGEHFTDHYTADSATFGIIANVLTTIKVPQKDPSYKEVNEMKYELQEIMKKYMKKWSRNDPENIEIDIWLFGTKNPHRFIHEFTELNDVKLKLIGDIEAKDGDTRISIFFENFEDRDYELKYPEQGEYYQLNNCFRG